MLYLTQFITIAIIHFLGLISPGPDFVLITRNSLVYSRRIGILSSIGLAAGILVHVTYSIAGIGLLISQSIVIFSTIKYLGAAYLIYIGLKSLFGKSRKEIGQHEQVSVLGEMSDWQAVRTGFLTNVLNPKVTLFFLAIFTQVIGSDTPLFIKVLYGMEMFLATGLWFSFVAYMCSHEAVRTRVSKIQHHIDRVTGSILILLGLKVALTK